MIPFIDLQTQYRGIRPEITAAVERVLDSGQYALGSEVDAFEAEFASYCAAPHAVAVSSGTNALHLALLVAGVGPGSEVITVPFTFVATVATIGYTGARTVFVDVEPHSFTLSPDQLEAAITERTRAIVPVHLYGQPADMDPVLRIARRYKLTVIEDAAQAHGAAYRGSRVGSLGDLACFSFYPTKNLGACGEGGAVTTSRPEHDQALRELRDWGQAAKYEHRVKGFNYRMDALQAAILRVKLRHLETWTRARQAHARRYQELLAEDVATPTVMAYARHVFQLYSVRAPKRDELRHELHRHGIQTGVHYPVPVHLQPAYRDLGYGPGDFPVSEEAAREVLSLPLYPELEEKDVRRVAQVLKSLVTPPRVALPGLETG